MKIIKELKYVIILSVILIVFSGFINYTYNKYIIAPILSKADQSITVDFVFFCVFIGIVFSFLKKLRKDYFVKTSQVIFCIIILSFYSYYRITGTHAFLSFRFLNHIKYFDVLLSYFIFPVLLKITSFLKQNKKNDDETASNLYLDTHIKTKKDDILDRAYKADRVIREIQNLKSEQSIAIGIVGEWGNGKTSFLNMIKESLKKKAGSQNNIVVDFNPWLNISLDSIIQDYFNTLEAELKDYSIDVAKSIKKYSNTVLNLHKSSFTESILKGTDLIFSSSLTDEFKQLNELLKSLNKRVIIFIDDFDRLQSNEIFEILKLIRNTAGFDTFTYIVAYDRNYLTKSLEVHGIPNPESFPEKIFLKEWELLPVTNEQINNYLLNELIEKFPSSADDVKNFFEGEITRFIPIASIRKVTFSLKHIRDAKRFLNSFITDYEEIKNEIFFRDFFILKLIKFKYYNIYTLLFNNRNDFIEKEHSNSTYYKNPKYILKKNKNEDSASDYYNIFENSIIEKYLKENFKYNENELLSIGALLNNLFLKSAGTKNNLSISYEVNYYKYFKDELCSEDLSIIEFKKTMSSPFEQIQKDMEKWHEEGKLINAKFYLSDTNIFDLKSTEEYERYVKSMIFMAKFKRFDINGRQELFSFDMDILWNNIDNRGNKIAQKFYTSNHELKKFILTILDQAEYPFEYESLFCYYLQDRVEIDSDVLDRETTRKYLAHYFREYTKSITSRDEFFWILFYRCKISNHKDVGGGRYEKINVYLDEAIEIFKEFMFKHLDSFLITFIDTPPFYRDSRDDFKLSLPNIIISIFGSYEKFIDLLKSPELKNSLTTPSEFLEEYIRFAEEFVKQGKAIEYTFNYLPANEKLDEIASANNY